MASLVRLPRIDMAFLIVAESLAVLLMCGLSQRMGLVSIRLRFYVSGFRINRPGGKLCIILGEYPLTPRNIDFET